MRLSSLEESFALWLRTEGLPEAERQRQFAPPRRWRFDFAWPASRVAVEVEGLVYRDGGGRHQRARGFENDCEKYEAALNRGWTVYRVPGSWVLRGRRNIWRPEVMVTLRALLERGETA